MYESDECLFTTLLETVLIYFDNDVRIFSLKRVWFKNRINSSASRFPTFHTRSASAAHLSTDSIIMTLSNILFYFSLCENPEFDPAGVEDTMLEQVE